MSPLRLSFSLLVALASFSLATAGEPEKYQLRYHFAPGQTLRWEVTHRAKVDTTVSGSTQTADTFTRSVKVWRVTAVKPGGQATFEHLVESIDMRQKLSGRPEVRYNSSTDKQAPAGFEQVAEAVGTPLSVVTLDEHGKVLHRHRKPLKAASAAPAESQITIPLPDEAVAVGHTWSMPSEVDVKLETGGIKKVKTLQRFTLEEVKTGVATISVCTQILTPIHDPSIESQLIECASAGTVRFDIDAGRILSQQMDVDRGVVGFRGATSSLHYLTRFTEKILSDGVTRVAGRGKNEG